MKLPAFSIRTILGFIIVMMGLFAFALSLLSGNIHRDLVFKNQKIMMKEMIGIAVKERIRDLNQVSQDLGLALQGTEKFKEALKNKNIKTLTMLLNNQFHQYFVTIGIIKLQQLVLFDKDFSMILESTDGTVFVKGNEKAFCSTLIERAQSRSGVQKMKILNGLCLYDNKPINLVVVPVGGLRLAGYLMIISDPSHNLSALEANLGMPLKLRLNSYETIFNSSTWPEDENKALIVSYSLKSSSGLDILSILTAQNISSLSKSLHNTRLEVLLIAGFGTFFIVGLSILIVRRTMLTPLSKLTYKLRHFNLSNSKDDEKLVITGTKEINEMCEGFNYMADAQNKAQKADQQKSQFLANMSHEIRTPLTAIIGFSETLYQNDKIKDWKQYLERIILNGEHLHQLINDILDLSKIEANQLSIENINVPICNLAMEIDSLIGEKANSKGLSFNLNFELPIPEVIKTDPTRLKQILINLCSNAVKFTEKGSVSLGIRYDQENHSMIFLIKDSGIGMTSDQILGLFQPFKQADSSTTRKFGGTGLGLYISKLLAEKLGGDIKVTSMKNIGSLFEVRILVDEIGMTWIDSETQIQLLYDNKELSIPTLKGNVLLAEDNLDNQKLISLFIENTGANVEIVGNGVLALEKATHENFDLILMDMQMPEMGGIDAIAKLRKENCKTPIAVLTANAMNDDKLKSKKAGANEFLTKPINQEAFYDLLKKYLCEVEHKNVHLINEIKTDRMKKLFNSFIARLPGLSDRFEALLDEKNWQSLDEEIHKLKGIGGSLGFSDVTDLSGDIEMKIKSGDYDFAERLIRSLIVRNREIFSKFNSE